MGVRGARGGSYLVPLSKPPAGRCRRACPPSRAGGRRRRFGYRRLLVLMRREGLTMNHKKFRRLYREERLQVRRRDGRKRARCTRAPLTIPQVPNQRWSLDFLSDASVDGRRFRILAVVDDFRTALHRCAWDCVSHRSQADRRCQVARPHYRSRSCSDRAARPRQ